MVDLPCRTLQLDGIWSFVGCKEKAKESAKEKHPGDVWTWTSICADTKLIPAWRVGDKVRPNRFTLKKTPAQAAGIADHQWSIDEMVAM